MTNQALGWKLMEDLNVAGVGTNNIEKASRERMQERMAKKGEHQREGFEKAIRDEGNIKHQLKRRIIETKEDWTLAKDKYQRERRALISMAEKQGNREYRKIKKDLKRVDKQNNNRFTKGRIKHCQKVEFLKHKYNAIPTQANESKDNWYTRIAQGTQGPIPKAPIPTY